jgi:hypothetical protein
MCRFICLASLCGYVVACGEGSDECQCNKNASCNSYTRCVDEVAQRCSDGPCCQENWYVVQDCGSSAQICLDNPWSAQCFDQNCADGFVSGDETDVDCGGSCPKCPDGAVCLLPQDCQDENCLDGICEYFCCNADATCLRPFDCRTEYCVEGICESSCFDGVINGDETDLDCGGDCLGCPDGDACLVPEDCLTGYCFGGICGF